jgi:hypothetical protein
MITCNQEKMNSPFLNSKKKITFPNDLTQRRIQIEALFSWVKKWVENVT